MSIADKLFNARAILMDYRQHGEAVWSRFHPDADTLWYYRALVTAFRERSEYHDLVDELERTVTALETLVAETKSKSGDTDEKLLVAEAESKGGATGDKLEVLLREINRPDLQSDTVAYIAPDGSLRFVTYDYGPTVEKVWGDSDYEWGNTISAADKDRDYGAGVRVLGYCLMTNHVRLIAVTEREDSLSILFRRVHGRV